MDLGEKIREARRKCGLSQQQLGQRLAVSRSAVAKWETGKGLPDVGNLKMLARLLNVRVDDLLEDPQEDGILREAYDRREYGYGCKKVQKDRFIRQRFPEGTVYTLLGRQQTPEVTPGGEEWDCRSPISGRPKQDDKAFYLVETEQGQFFAMVTDTFLELRPLDPPLEGSRFSMDGWDFVKCNY